MKHILAEMKSESGQKKLKLISQVPQTLCGLINVAGSRAFIMNSAMGPLQSAARSRDKILKYSRVKDGYYAGAECHTGNIYSIQTKNTSVAPVFKTQ